MTTTRPHGMIDAENKNENKDVMTNVVQPSALHRHDNTTNVSHGRVWFEILQQHQQYQLKRLGVSMSRVEDRLHIRTSLPLAQLVRESILPQTVSAICTVQRTAQPSSNLMQEMYASDIRVVPCDMVLRQFPKAKSIISWTMTWPLEEPVQLACLSFVVPDPELDEDMQHWCPVPTTTVDATAFANALGMVNAVAGDAISMHIPLIQSPHDIHLHSTNHASTIPSLQDAMTEPRHPSKATAAPLTFPIVDCESFREMCAYDPRKPLLQQLHLSTTHTTDFRIRIDCRTTFLNMHGLMFAVHIDDTTAETKVTAWLDCTDAVSDVPSSSNQGEKPWYTNIRWPNGYVKHVMMDQLDDLFQRLYHAGAANSHVLPPSNSVFARYAAWLEKATPSTLIQSQLTARPAVESKTNDRLAPSSPETKSCASIVESDMSRLVCDRSLLGDLASTCINFVNLDTTRKNRLDMPNQTDVSALTNNTSAPPDPHTQHDGEREMEQVE